MQQNQPGKTDLDKAFLIQPREVTRKFAHPEPVRALAFTRHAGDFETWRRKAKDKLAELLNVKMPAAGPVKELRQTVHDKVRIKALVMQVSDELAIPAYLLAPEAFGKTDTAIMAIHGHGRVEPCIGERDDYHHQFALKLAQEGFLVLCPELRGFGVLADLAADCEGQRLDYWNPGYRQFTLVTDGFQHGQTLIGQTVEDLLRWEAWLAGMHGIKTVKVCGISYGGDLALTYPVFSGRVERIFASGTLGSFTPIFARCYNAPAHCVPGVLRYLDRSDIAGLNAPRPVVLHYGELDRPSKDNYSASYNETVEPSIKELKQIYGALKAEDRVRLMVSKGKRHEMDNEALIGFMKEK